MSYTHPYYNQKRQLPRVALALALSIALAGCGGGDHAPPEISLGLVSGDFNGSGRSSIIATSTVQYNLWGNPGNLQVFLSTGTDTFAAPVLIADGDDPLYLATADLNGDHLPDVVSASYYEGTLSVFLSNAQSPGSFAAPLILPSPGASQVAIADMNGDGLPDLISADFNVSLFIQSTPGAFASPISLYPGGADWVEAADLNGDGVPDVALTDSVGVKLLFHTGEAGTSTYSAPVAVFTQTANANLTGANLIAIADVNGDGLNDLVITDPGATGGASPAVYVLLQDPSNHGQFLQPVGYPIAPYSAAQSIIVSDVNGDGHPDIVIGGSGAVTVLLQNAASPGTFLAATSYTVQNANEIAVADVNGDGLPDIILGTGPAQAVSNGVTPNVPGVLLQNAGSPGTFGALQALP